MYERIAYDVSDATATVTLNRPEKLNAYTPEMGEEVVDAFKRALGDSAVRVVILTGAGRGFCAGVDLDYLKAHAAGERLGTGPKLGEESFVRQWPLELFEYPKPVIAAINGAAFGVGVTMTLPCDIRLAAENAKFGLNFTKLGVLPGLGSTHLLPRLVGIAKAIELVLTARTLLAAEAAEIGLIHRVVAPGALMDEARAIASVIGEVKPEVLTAAKQALHYGAVATMAEAMQNERQRSAALREGGADTAKSSG
jgi:2-(1,2-epoxy-1,2-dihydrophenyl)acetyl-CoA isomerase